MRTGFHLVYTALAINFFIPVAIYIGAPEMAINQFVELGTLLGGTEYPFSEQSVFWRVLAIANVATLGFCCILLQVNLQKFWSVLYPLVFLKGCAALGFGVAFLMYGYPGFLAGCSFDLVTCGLFVLFGRGARRASSGLRL